MAQLCRTPYKVQYPTKHSAMSAIRYGFAKGNFAYHCVPGCNKWHTSTNKGSTRKKRARKRRRPRR